jgi:hypothetical protein
VCSLFVLTAFMSENESWPQELCQVEVLVASDL